MPDPRTVPSVAPLIRRKRVYVALLIAIACLISGAIAMWKAIDARNRLQSIEARVRYCEPVRYRTLNGNARFRTQVELSYAVNGQPYLVPVSMPEVVASEEELSNLLSRYRAGATIPILYDAARPDDVELEVGSTNRFYLLPLAVLAAGLACLTFVFITVASEGRYYCVVCGTGVAEQHAFCYMCGERIPTRKGRMIG